jgi:hypothetical protein
MTCARDVYEKAGGKIHCSNNTTLSTGAGDRNTTIVTGVSGKIIVPAWFVVSASDADGSAELQLSLRGVNAAGSNRENQLIDYWNCHVAYFNTY